MISDEIRNGIEAKSDIQKSKNNSMDKKEAIPEIEQRELRVPRNMYDLIET